MDGVGTARMPYGRLLTRRFSSSTCRLMADKDEVSRKCTALADLVRVGAGGEGGGGGKGGTCVSPLPGAGFSSAGGGCQAASGAKL